MRAAIYARVSTEEQTKGYSIQDQIEKATQKAKELGATSITIFKDEGYSGADPNRPALQELISKVKQGFFDLVVCYDVDRWARDLYDQLAFAEIVEKYAKLEFVTHSRGDPDSPEDNLFFQMKGAFAQYERAKIKQRTMAGRYAKAHSGKIVIPGGWPGHPGPYGYIYNGDSENPQFEIVEHEAEVVRKMFHWIAKEGLGIGAVTIRLNEEKIPPPHGKQWYISTVNRILHNEVYIGNFYNFKFKTEISEDRKRRYRKRSKDQWIKVQVPPIIPKELWEEAHAKIKENGIKTRVGRKHEYLMAGRIVCGFCGRKYYTTPQSGKPYYRCSGKKRIVSLETCKSPILPAHTNRKTLGVDDIVWAAVKERLKNPDIIIEELKKLASEKITEETDAIKEKIKVKRNRLSQLERQKDRLIDLYLNNIITKEDLSRRIEPINKQIDALMEEIRIEEMKLEEMEFEKKRPLRFEEVIKKYSEHLETLTFKEKREIIDMLDITVTVKPGGEVEINWPFEENITCGNYINIGFAWLVR